MDVIIPAAGYATRLYPLTKNTAKALLPIGQRPILEYCLDKIEQLPEVENVYIVTNEKFAQQFIDRGEAYMGQLHIEIINDGTSQDGEKLGTLGDIQYVIEQKNITRELLIFAGDNLIEGSLLPIYETFKRTSATTIGVYDVQDLDLARQFGIVDMDETGKITSFVEKPQQPTSTLAGTLIYFLRAQDLPTIKACVDQGRSDKAGRLFETLIDQTDVYAHPLRGYWYDIGNKDQLDQARALFL